MFGMKVLFSNGGKRMEKRGQRFFRLIVLLFTLTVSVPLFPCEMVNTYGVFGEVQTSIVVNSFREEVSEIASKHTEHVRVKGTNIFNIWLLVSAGIVCIVFEMCIYRLPRDDTIVAKKVRMDN